MQISGMLRLLDDGSEQDMKTHCCSKFHYYEEGYSIPRQELILTGNIWDRDG